MKQNFFSKWFAIKKPFISPFKAIGIRLAPLIGLQYNWVTKESLGGRVESIISGFHHYRRVSSRRAIGFKASLKCSQPFQYSQFHILTIFYIEKRKNSKIDENNILKILWKWFRQCQFSGRIRLSVFLSLFPSWSLLKTLSFNLFWFFFWYIKFVI